MTTCRITRFRRRVGIFHLLLLLLLPVAAQGQTVYIPHITSGHDDWTDYLQVDNNSTSDATFSLILYSGGDTVYAASHEVSKLGERTPMDLKALGPTATCGKITFTESRLCFRLAYEYVNGGIAEFTLAGNLAEELSFNFSSFTDRVVTKGVCLANFGNARADVVFYAFGGGSILDTALVSINPDERFLADQESLFTDIGTSRLKRVVAVSEGSFLTGIAMQGNTDLTNLLFTAAVPVDNFALGDQNPEGESWDWAGTWMSGRYRLDGTLTLAYALDGTALSGTLTMTGSDCGPITAVPVSGSVATSSVSFSAAITCLGYPAVLTFSQGVIVQDEMNGQYVLSLDGTNIDSGSYVLERRR